MRAFFYTLSIAAAGFFLGWWTHGRYQDAPILPPKPVTVRPAAAPLIPSKAPTTLASSESTVSRFSDLLAAGDLERAMQAYDELSAADPARMPRLRARVLETLRDALARDKGETLQALADAWLSRYYDDIDVLLILAEFQRRQGFPDEAARVVQFAETYAYEPAQREKVTSYLQALVSGTDAALAAQGRWVELLGFYQLLENVGLSTPEYRLGQALVCLELGDFQAARTLLQPLTEHASLAGQAAGLLALMEPAPRAAQPVASDRGEIALKRQGGHHLLPVRLNDSVDATLLIDTGASITSLSQQRFDELSSATFFQYRGWRLFNTAGGHARGDIYRADTVRLGEQVVEDVDIAVLDFRPRGGVDGLLGMNVLRHFRFEIDQDRNVLKLERR